MSTPHVSVCVAVIASMAVPLVFEPVKINGDVYVDGALQMNMPTHIYPIEETMYIWLKYNKTNPMRSVDTMDIGRFMQRCLGGIFNTQHAYTSCILKNYMSHCIQVQQLVPAYQMVRVNHGRYICHGINECALHMRKYEPDTKLMLIYVISMVVILSTLEA